MNRELVVQKISCIHLEEKINYDGSQLHSLFAYLNFGVAGDSLVSFRGGCKIDFSRMLDGEDLNQRAIIEGSDMLHFIIELFDLELYSAVCLQRIFADHVKEIVLEMTQFKYFFERSGDDVFIIDQDGTRRKLSISIATKSPISSLIHFAVNVSTVGTPVPTVGLAELKIDTHSFVSAISEKFCNEVGSIKFATVKVRPVQ